MLGFSKMLDHREIDWYPEECRRSLRKLRIGKSAKNPKDACNSGKFFESNRTLAIPRIVVNPQNPKELLESRTMQDISENTKNAKCWPYQKMLGIPSVVGNSCEGRESRRMLGIPKNAEIPGNGGNAG